MRVYGGVEGSPPWMRLSQLDSLLVVMKMLHLGCLKRTEIGSWNVQLLKAWLSICGNPKPSEMCPQLCPQSASQLEIVALHDSWWTLPSTGYSVQYDYQSIAVDYHPTPLYAW